MAPDKEGTHQGTEKVQIRTHTTIRPDAEARRRRGQHDKGFPTTSTGSLYRMLGSFVLSQGGTTEKKIIMYIDIISQFLTTIT